MIEKAILWWEMLPKSESEKLIKKHKVKTETVKTKVKIYFNEIYLKTP